MKRAFTFFILLNCFWANSQSFSSYRINLVSYISPQSTVGIGTDGRKYSGCWGWYQSSTTKEYGIVGTSTGVYFIDISLPGAPSVRDFVPGKQGCTWREMKTYQNYCYIISDDAAPNQFQIVDMQYLPDSVHVVYSGNSTYFERGHTLWVDKDKLYIGSETKLGGEYNSMALYSLATPSNPVFLRHLVTDASYISVVHDMFVNNDTIFASCGNQGLYVFKYNPSDTTFSELGSFTNYDAGSAYNHSSCITQNKKNLVFTDEVPDGLPIHIIDIQNLGNIVTTATINPNPHTTPHNPFVIGNRWAIVSCYQDGLNIYDINDPSHPVFAGFFDTYPQSGANTGDYSDSPYRGNWGAYPYFPSGLIMALDMQNGVFILDPSSVYTQPLGVKELNSSDFFMEIYPNPVANQLTIKSNLQTEAELKVNNLLGQTLINKSFDYFGNRTLDVSGLQNGTYFITVKTANNSFTKKIIINK
jgi:choice-of-anchor B domain-containing protein